MRCVCEGDARSVNEVNKARNSMNSILILGVFDVSELWVTFFLDQGPRFYLCTQVPCLAEEK